MDDLMTVKECKDFNIQNDMNSSVISSSSSTSSSNIFKSNIDLSSSFNQDSPSKNSFYSGFHKRSKSISNYDIFKIKTDSHSSGLNTISEYKINSNADELPIRRRAISESQSCVACLLINCRQGCQGSGGKPSFWMGSGAGSQENQQFADRMRHASSKDIEEAMACGQNKVRMFLPPL